jgi:hypothetical protein
VLWTSPIAKNMIPLAWVSLNGYPTRVDCEQAKTRVWPERPAIELLSCLPDTMDPRGPKEK